MRFSFAFAIILFILLATSPGLACTCVHTPLSKRFKKADAIFIGKLADDEPEDTRLIQNYSDGLFVFEVVKSWKGIKKEYVSIGLGEFPKSAGNCQLLYHFDEDAEYLVFAYGKDLEVEVECSDTRPLRPSYDYTTREIAKLDSFWFRFFSRMRPF